MTVSRRSKQREAVLEVLTMTKLHPTAEWVYAELKKSYPNIGLATVYRNLKLFEKQGRIVKIDVGDGFDHFDADTSEHSHFFCRECGRVLDVELESFDAKSLLPSEFSYERHQLVFFGRCRDCIKEQCS